jgi:hypothetical protein
MFQITQAKFLCPSGVSAFQLPLLATPWPYVRSLITKSLLTDPASALAERRAFVRISE